MSSYCYFLLAAYQKNLKYCFEIMLIFCYQLSSDCMQPVSNRCPTFLILLIFLPGNHGLHVYLAMVMTCNNAIFTHRMLPVPKTTFCKHFLVLPRFCSKKTTCITVCSIFFLRIFKPVVQSAPLRAKTTIFIPSHCSWKFYFWLYWDLIWSYSNICWNIVFLTSTSSCHEFRAGIYDIYVIFASIIIFYKSFTITICCADSCTQS